MTQQPKILVFDAHHAKGLAYLLSDRFGYCVLPVSTLDGVIQETKKASFDLLILDLCDWHCRELVDEFLKLPGKVLFLTCGEDMHRLRLPTGAEIFIEKPIEVMEFIGKVRTLLGERVQ